MVRFPGNPRDAAGEDLAAPTVALLTGIDLLAKEEDRNKAQGPGALLGSPPPSVAIIEAGAASLSKWWSAVLGAGITLAGVTAAVKGVRSAEHDAVRIAIIAGAAVVLAALALAIAIIVSSDVRGRAAGAATQIHARASVATTFLTLSRAPSASSPQQLTTALLVAAALRGSFRVLVDGHQDYEAVTGVRLDPVEHLQVQVGGAWIATSQVQAFST